MWYSLLADLVNAIHLAYVGYVVFGLLLIYSGILFRWQWIRNRWFRLTHLVMIVIVVAEEIVSFECPLTTWERQLRSLAGQTPRAGTFVSDLMEKLLFPVWPEWVYTTVYFTVGLLVLATFWLAPPRWRRPQAPA